MINVTLIPILPHNDNYAYILEADNGDVAVVDPGDAAPFIEYLEAKSLKPSVIFITHHHWDHTDGLADMLAWHSCPVAGPEKEADKIQSLDILLNENSVFAFGGEDIQIIETPGHTLGHICYYAVQSGFLLSGDTIFSLGCGRLFEGSARDMWASVQRVSALPDDTMIYCGHEYTLSNAKFSVNIEPDNQALRARLQEVEAMRTRGEPTIPVSLKLEKQTNVFLRAGSAERFAEIRTLKDNA